MAELKSGSTMNGQPLLTEADLVGYSVSAAPSGRYYEMANRFVDTPKVSDQLGVSLSVSSDGNTMAMGGFFGAAIDADVAVYVYTREGDQWTNEQILKPSVQLTAGEYFGRSVAISGDGNNLLIGASRYNTPANNSGAVYAFSRTNGTWAEDQIIQSSDIALGDEFGYSISVSDDGTVAVIGAPAERGTDEATAQVGSAYVFSRSGTTWTQDQKLLPATERSGGQVGYTVDMTGDGVTAIVTGGRGTSDGVNVYTKPASTWVHQAEVFHATIASSDELDCTSLAVSDDGKTIVAGAWLGDINFQNAGGLYVFTSTDGVTWGTEDQFIQSDDVAALGYIGTVVAISGDGNTLAAKGLSYGANDPNATNGAVNIYNKVGASWTHTQTLKGNDNVTPIHDRFGSSIHISYNGKVVDIGSSGNNTATVNNAGSVFSFFRR